MAAIKIPFPNARHFYIFVCLVLLPSLVMYGISLRPLTTFMRTINILRPIQMSLNALYQLGTHNVDMKKRLCHIAKEVKVRGVDCTAVFDNSSKAIVAAKSVKKTVSPRLSETFYLHITKNCADFRKQRGYIIDSLTEEEKQFPLAYSMIVYKDAEMVERLLRAIYRPQNVYCIHVDSKAPVDTFRVISAIANCFLNVFITSRRMDVAWGKFSVLKSELLCMEELWRYKKWKYFINLTGQEFPLRTNYELVKILKVFNGANDVVTSAQGEFVDYILHNQTAQRILNWAGSTMFPDETFFAVLNANPHLGIKGTYKGPAETTATRSTVARYQQRTGTPCTGRFVRKICILSTGDLPRLSSAKQMFANKFYLHKDRVVIGCLEEKIFNDTRDEYTGFKTFDTTYYENLDFVKNKVE